MRTIARFFGKAFQRYPAILGQAIFYVFIISLIKIAGSGLTTVGLYEGPLYPLQVFANDVLDLPDPLVFTGVIIFYLTAVFFNKLILLMMPTLKISPGRLLITSFIVGPIAMLPGIIAEFSFLLFLISLGF